MFGFDIINDTPTTNKTIFLRCDFNVPLDENGNIIDDGKIKLSLPTIKYLVKTGARVVIGTHIGNPKGTFNEKLSTKVIYKYLQRVLRCQVHFCNDCIGDDTKREIFRASYGDVVVLENLRFHPEEENCNFNFAKQLSDGMNLYVNDALSCCNLQYASILGVPLFISATAGLTLAKNVEIVKKVFENRDTLIILGGKNLAGKIEIINNLADRVKYIAIVGTLANAFFSALGNNVGKSIRAIEYEEEILDAIRKAEKNDCQIILPVDVFVSNDISSTANIEQKLATQLEKNDIIVDIAEKSISNIKYLLSSVKNVIWYGSAGISELAKFANGSIEICNEIADLTNKEKITSLAGGKNVISIIKQEDKIDSFSFISNSNQVFSMLLSGKILPGLEILHRLSKTAEMQ